MIIGIGHVAQVGKSTIAKYLTELYGFTELSFADPLKSACREIFHLSDEQLYGKLKEVIDPYWGVTPRFILQKVGTECMRSVYDKDIWIKSAGALMKKNPLINYVIPDVRFRNEANFIHDFNGTLIRVDRILNSGATGGIVGHPSEVELLDYKGWDYIIHNDSTLKDLYRKVDNLMELIKK